MDLFTGWSDDFGEPQRPKKTKGRIVRRQPAPITHKHDIKLEEKKTMTDVVETPAGTIAVSATSSEYSVDDIATIKTVDVDAENIDTGAELKIDAAVVYDNATGEVVAAAGVIEYTEPEKTSTNEEIRYNPSSEIVPIKSSQSYIDWVQKISGEGKKKKDDKKDKKDKKKKKKKSSKKQIMIEDETDLDRLASVHSEGKMKSSVTISSEKDLDDFIDKQRHKHHSDGQYYGAYFDPTTNSLQEGGRPTAGVSVPLTSVHVGGRKIPPSAQKHHSYGDKRRSALDVSAPLTRVKVGDQYHSSSDNLLDVSVPLTRVQVGDHYESSSSSALDVSVPFTRLQVGGDKQPMNVISKDEDLDDYVEEMMEMRNAGMAKKKSKSTSKEGEYYKKAKQKYAKRDKFLTLLNAHEKKALEDFENIPMDQQKKRKSYDAIVKYIQSTKKMVIKAKPDEIDDIFARYRTNMAKVESAIAKSN